MTDDEVYLVKLDNDNGELIWQTSFDDYCSEIFDNPVFGCINKEFGFIAENNVFYFYGEVQPYLDSPIDKYVFKADTATDEISFYDISMIDYDIMGEPILLNNNLVFRTGFGFTSICHILDLSDTTSIDLHVISDDYGHQRDISYVAGLDDYIVAVMGTNKICLFNLDGIEIASYNGYNYGMNENFKNCLIIDDNDIYVFHEMDFLNLNREIRLQKLKFQDNELIKENEYLVFSGNFLFDDSYITASGSNNYIVVCVGEMVDKKIMQFDTELNLIEGYKLSDYEWFKGNKVYPFLIGGPVIFNNYILLMNDLKRGLFSFELNIPRVVLLGETGYDIEKSITAQTHCPVHLHAYDSNGNHTGINVTNGEIEEDIPYSFFMNSSENGFEQITVQGLNENITFTIEGIDIGNFDFEIVMQNGTGDAGYSYNNISITDNSTAHLNISDENPDNVMFLDFDGNGITDEEIYPNNIPIANFSYSPLLPKTNDLIQFYDLSIDLDGDINSWYWDFGNGNISNENNPNYQYISEGTYIVCFNVTDDGAFDSVSKTITVQDDYPPVISVKYPLNDTIYNPRPLSEFNITIFDLDADNLTMYLRWINHSGMISLWEDIYNWIDIPFGNYKYVPPNRNQWIWGNTTYIWSVNVTDGLFWTNETYSFTTIGSRYDVNNNDIVNFQDAGLVWIHRTSEVDYDGIYDVNQNGVVNFQDAGLTWVNRD